MQPLKPVRLFIYSFVLLTIVCMIALVVLPSSLKEERTISTLGNVATILQGSLGIAVSFAGAVVAIVISAVTYHMLRLQDERQAFESINTIIEEATIPIMTVAKRYSSLYVSMINLNQEINGVVEALGDTWRQKVLSTECLDHDLVSRGTVADSLDKLADALDAVWGDTYSSFVWNWKNLSDVYLSRALLVAGHSFDAQRDLPELALLLRTRAGALRKEVNKPTFGSVLTPRLAANIAKTQSGEPFDHAGLRDFLQGGAEIMLHKNGEKLQNVGAAILVAIARCIPNEQEYNAALSELFAGRKIENLLKQAPMLRSFRKVPPRGWFGHSLSSVLQDYEKLKPTLIIP